MKRVIHSQSVIGFVKIINICFRSIICFWSIRFSKFFFVIFTVEVCDKSARLNYNYSHENIILISYIGCFLSNSIFLVLSDSFKYSCDALKNFEISIELKGSSSFVCFVIILFKDITNLWRIILVLNFLLRQLLIQREE